MCFIIWKCIISNYYYLEILQLYISKTQIDVQSLIDVIIVSKPCPCPNGCDVIWSMRQWRNWTSIWESEKRSYIWELDADLRIGRRLETGDKTRFRVHCTSILADPNPNPNLTLTLTLALTLTLTLALTLTLTLTLTVTLTLALTLTVTLTLALS
jgi:hypothetical protein